MKLSWERCHRLSAKERREAPSPTIQESGAGIGEERGEEAPKEPPEISERSVCGGLMPLIVTKTISFAFYRCQNSGTEKFRDLPREEQLRAGSFGARNLALPSAPPDLACSVGWGRLGLGAGDALARSWELRDGGGARNRSSTESLRSSLI